MKHRIALALLLVAAAALAAVFAALATGATRAHTDTRTSQHSSASGYHILVMAWPTTDPFFSAMQKGVAAAGSQLGVSAEYAFPTEANAGPPDWVRRFQAGLNHHPNAVVVADFFPSAADRIIKRLVTNGTPVVFINSGLSSFEKIGGLTFVGQDDYNSGVAAGATFAKAGVKDLLYVDDCPANPSCNDRGAGMKKAMKGRTVKVLNLSNSASNDPSAAEQAIAGTLASNKSIDAIASSAVQLDPIQKAIAQIGRRGIKVGLWDFTTAAVQAVKNGQLLFDVDQQAYLEGYYGVLAAYQNLKYGMHPVGQISTGPLVITKKDAAKALQAAASGVRGG